MNTTPHHHTHRAGGPGAVPPADIRPFGPRMAVVRTITAHGAPEAAHGNATAFVAASAMGER